MADSPDASPDALHDTTWIVVDPVTHTDTIEVVVAFADGAVSGFSGCNRFRGEYTFDGAALSFGALAGTMMACSDEAMALERDVLSRLAAVRRAMVGGDALAMLGEDGAVLLRLRPSSGDDVLGSWVVTGIHYPAREAIISARGELTLTIEQGRIAGHGGCNTFGGPIAITGDTVRVGPLMSTRKFCGDEDADGGPSVMEQEAALLAALEHADRFLLEGSRLTFVRPDGGISVSLTR